jgi:pimeloyl-ACP methyl ester carboxylesterase
MAEKNQTADQIPRLQYLGFSYGTALGNTFAFMFPGRVGRVVLDGVADAQDYIDGVSFDGSIFYHDRPAYIFPSFGVTI